jgi:hypothetical protein
MFSTENVINEHHSHLIYYCSALKGFICKDYYLLMIFNNSPLNNNVHWFPFSQYSKLSARVLDENAENLEVNYWYCL